MPLVIMRTCIAVKSAFRLTNMQRVSCMNKGRQERRIKMRKPTATDNELFNRFWKAYPRKEGKPKALRTFEKLVIDEATLLLLLKELERQSKMKDWKHINTKFIPLAQTWLNRRDWEEEQNGNTESDTGKAEHRYGSWI